jgi:hypothetical protein
VQLVVDWDGTTVRDTLLMTVERFGTAERVCGKRPFPQASNYLYV